VRVCCCDDSSKRAQLARDGGLDAWLAVLIRTACWSVDRRRSCLWRPRTGRFRAYKARRALRHPAPSVVMGLEAVPWSALCGAPFAGWAGSRRLVAAPATTSRLDLLGIHDMGEKSRYVETWRSVDDLVYMHGHHESVLRHRHRPGRLGGRTANGHSGLSGRRRLRPRVPGRAFEHAASETSMGQVIRPAHTGRSRLVSPDTSPRGR
jgi:hypothetical protein